MVTDAQTPQNPRGNLLKDDYELVYTAEASFDFPGGGLIIGFGASPPGAYADTGCEQVLVSTISSDASGLFCSRFYGLPDQTSGLLDAINYGGTAVELGGVVIQGASPSTVAADIGSVVDDLYASGVVNGGQANSLMRKIEQALNLLAKGKNAEAIVVLEGFIQQVNDLTYVDFVLTPAQAAELISRAQILIQLV